MSKFLIITGLLLVAIGVALHFAPVCYAQEETVRVAILREVPEARITVLAPCRLTDLKTGASIGDSQWPHLKWQRIVAESGGLKIGNTPSSSSAVLIEPIEQAIIRVNAQPYRGDLIIYRSSAGKITLVNRLDLEEYLVGALASEVDPAWPMEALKAHAIVSRTMVAHRMWIEKKSLFDVTADTQTHVYHGVSVESPRTREAVRATAGEVLAYQNELLSAAFHANCGGHTEDASEIWAGKLDGPPLKGRPDPYCHDLKHYHWKTNMLQKDFAKMLESIAPETGAISACEIVERNRSGRVRSIRIIGPQGSAVLTGKRFRELLGANRLRSLNFSIQMNPKGVYLEGLGWGHGVGLCQWGAYGMASQGHKSNEILDFYFSGAQRRRLQGLPGFSTKS